MIIAIGPLENAAGIPCTHERCDGRPARWFVQRSSTRDLSCSVHLARFAERDEETAVTLDTDGVFVEPIGTLHHERCSHPRCDGRAAKWQFPQTAYLPTGAFRACSVHLPRFCEIVLKYHVSATTRLTVGRGAPRPLRAGR